ncbi:long-chain acyl-CoA synthetase [Desulfuromusa kysingii]|uniref:Long-chain acyl-CoA synthetase n=1 Tax=Desulfuromusa kysingii TaxID=37625 RepID=A0A1H4DEW6_9BACT|nr:long-chain fatty acid--CoA ligase [Desulfuromusa kysingii]SEA71046.1 long-chain acyl-CoA synthetase [Desulfuromusa kysingii]
MTEARAKKLPYRSIPQMMQVNAEKYADRPAISFKKGGGYITLNYQQFYSRILMTARGLRKAGMQAGDRVAIFSENRAGWVIADMGIQAALGISVPVYATNTGVQAAYVINHSGSKIVFVSDRSQYEKLLAVRDQIPQVEMVFSFERFLGERNLPVHTLYQLSEISYPIQDKEKQQIEEQIASIDSTDLITVIYTSGTTGIPKGVMLTQHNMAINAWDGIQRAGEAQMTGTFLSFLPLSHVLERTAGYYAVLMGGGHIAFAEDVNKVVENILEVKPSAMISVPRLFEKIYSRIYENIHLLGPVKRQLFHSAIATGHKYIHAKYIRHQSIGLLGLKYKIYDRLVFRKIRSRFGGQLKFFICGGAPLDKTINEFMWIIGIPVFEGYGLTETSPAIALNSLHENRFGSVGKALGDTEFKLLEDGELLVKGSAVMRGYYQDQKATANAFVDGWFKTGDIAHIDEQGYVYIVDRKKEIIVTAGGKNIAPQPLENTLKLDKYISQAYIHGDTKPYLIAILTPNFERLIEFGHEKHINYLSVDDLVANEQVKQLFAERIALFNKNLASYQTIKKFILLPREFSTEGGELTPTMKLKRKEIYKTYKDKIEQLYQHNGEGQNSQPQSENGGKNEAN